MAKYEVGIATSVTTTNSALWELRAPSARVLTLRELVITNVAATAARIGLGRPAAVGSPTSPVLGQAVDPVSGVALGAVAAVTTATAPTIFLRRFNLGASIGAGASFVWGPDEMSIAAAGVLVLWSQSVVGLLDVFAKWEE